MIASVILAGLALVPMDSLALEWPTVDSMSLLDAMLTCAAATVAFLVIARRPT